MVILMPVKRRYWRKFLLCGSGALVAVLLVITSSLKFVADTSVGSKWLYSDNTNLRRVRELSYLTDTGDSQSIENAQKDSESIADNLLHLDSTISHDLHICSTPHSSLPHILTNTSHPYHQMVLTGVQATRTFVPKTYDSKFDNPCWFSTMPALPPNLHEEFTNYRGCMPDVMDKYTLGEALKITKTAISTPAKSCTVNTLMKSTNLSTRVVPPPCMRLAKDLGYVSSSNDPPFLGNVSNISRRFGNCVCKYGLYCLPRVMLAGFPKCATTSLYYMMVKHPQVARSRMKEAHFWRDQFIATKVPYKQLQILYYIFHFERSSAEIITNPTHISVDGSTTTLFPGLYTEIYQDEDMCILPRMLTDLIPSVKFIIMMRNPVDRIYSDFWYLCAKFYWKDGRKVTVPEDYIRNGTTMFHQATLNMISEFNNCVKAKSIFECVRRAGVGYAGDVACKGPRIGISLYYYHIIRWLNVLPRDRFIFLRTEDFLSDPTTAMNQVYRFLGVSTIDSEIALSSKNVNTWIKSTEYKKQFVMPKETREMLNEFFDPYNKLLTHLLNDDKYMWRDIPE